MKTITLGGIEYELTNEKIRRIVSAILDTERIIDNLTNEKKTHLTSIDERTQLADGYRKHVEFLKGLLA